MSNLRDLYQQVIIDHSKHPRNFCVCEHANHVKDGYNPLCGDHITLYIDEKDGTITDVCFKGAGCAISTASASLMTEAIKGKTVAEALQLFADFQKLVTSDSVNTDDSNGSGSDAENDNQNDKLGKLAVFAGVREFPLRVKCATLPWHTLKAALTGEKNDVTTE